MRGRIEGYQFLEGNLVQLWNYKIFGWWRRAAKCGYHKCKFEFLSSCIPKQVTVTYTEGLQLTSGSVSTSTKIELALTKAVRFAPFPTSTSSIISHEIRMVNTHKDFNKWYKEAQMEFTFPPNQDCSLYQRRIKFVSEISGDDLVQTPADFAMVCSPMD